MDTQKAAELSLKRCSMERGSERDIHGKSVEHAIWMLTGIVEGYIQHEKAHRWLGYAQAVLVQHDVISLEQCKEINERASGDG